MGTIEPADETPAIQPAVTIDSQRYEELSPDQCEWRAVSSLLRDTRYAQVVEERLPRTDAYGDEIAGSDSLEALVALDQPQLTCIYRKREGCRARMGDDGRVEYDRSFYNTFVPFGPLNGWYADKSGTQAKRVMVRAPKMEAIWRASQIGRSVLTSDDKFAICELIMVEAGIPFSAASHEAGPLFQALCGGDGWSEKVAKKRIMETGKKLVWAKQGQVRGLCNREIMVDGTNKFSRVLVFAEMRGLNVSAMRMEKVFVGVHDMQTSYSATKLTDLVLAVGKRNGVNPFNLISDGNATEVRMGRELLPAVRDQHLAHCRLELQRRIASCREQGDLEQIDLVTSDYHRWLRSSFGDLFIPDALNGRLDEVVVNFLRRFAFVRCESHALNLCVSAGIAADAEFFRDLFAFCDVTHNTSAYYAFEKQWCQDETQKLLKGRQAAIFDDEMSMWRSTNPGRVPTGVEKMRIEERAKARADAETFHIKQQAERQVQDSLSDELKMEIILDPSLLRGAPEVLSETFHTWVGQLSDEATAVKLGRRMGPVTKIRWLSVAESSGAVDVHSPCIRAFFNAMPQQALQYFNKIVRDLTAEEELKVKAAIADNKRLAEALREKVASEGHLGLSIKDTLKELTDSFGRLSELTRKRSQGREEHADDQAWRSEIDEQIRCVEGAIEMEKGELNSLQDQLAGVVGERKAIAAQLKAAQMVADQSASPEEIMGLFIAHRIMPDLRVNGVLAFGASVSPFDEAEAEMPEGNDQLSADEKKELEFGAALADEMVTTIDRDFWDTGELGHMQKWAADADADLPLGDASEYAEDFGELLVSSGNFLTEIAAVDSFLDTNREYAPLLRQLMIINKQSQADTPANCGLILTRQIEAFHLIEQYSKVPATAAFCEGYRQKFQHIVRRNPEQQTFWWAASIFDPRGFHPSWNSALAKGCVPLCADIQQMLDAMPANSDRSLFDWRRAAAAATGGPGREGQRIAPKEQLRWLMDRKVEIKLNPALMQGMSPIEWYLRVAQDIAPELTMVSLYVLCRSNSSAGIERRISQLRRVLTFYRNRMDPRTLELLMFMQADRQLLERIHLSPRVYDLVQQYRSLS
jgi:hypothetical protein